jgi:Uri superfamily endonuclease
MNRSNSLSRSQNQTKAQSDIAKGAYVLLLWLSSSEDVTVGKLGTISFARGFYAYVGSAMGVAGFKRVGRHLDVAAGRRKTQKWHVDYLLPVSEVIKTVEIETQERIECRIAHSLRKNPSLASIRGFGSSDCRCCSHLFYSRRLNDLEDAAQGLIYDPVWGHLVNQSPQGLRKEYNRREQVRTGYLISALNRDCAKEEHLNGNFD